MEVVRRELPWRVVGVSRRVLRVSCGRIPEIFAGSGSLTREEVRELVACVEADPVRAARELRRLQGVCFAELECGGVPLVVHLVRAADRARSLEPIAPLMRSTRPYPRKLVWMLSRNFHKWRATTQREVLQCAAMQPNKAIGFLLLLGSVARRPQELCGPLGPAPPRTAREMHAAIARALQSAELSANQKRRIVLLLAQHNLLQPLVLFQEPRLVRPPGPATNWTVAPCTLLDDILPLLDERDWDSLAPALAAVPEELYPHTLAPTLLKRLRDARDRANQFDRLEEFAGACTALCYFDPSFVRYF